MGSFCGIVWLADKAEEWPIGQKKGGTVGEVITFIPVGWREIEPG